jgi:hypothetical protein
MTKPTSISKPTVTQNNQISSPLRTKIHQSKPKPFHKIVRFDVKSLILVGFRRELPEKTVAPPPAVLSGVGIFRERT